MFRKNFNNSFHVVIIYRVYIRRNELDVNVESCLIMIRPFDENTFSFLYVDHDTLAFIHASYMRYCKSHRMSKQKNNRRSNLLIFSTNFL